jgi:hypothetical protein
MVFVYVATALAVAIGTVLPFCKSNDQCTKGM